jgi:RNA polymerase sigma-32 factor
MVKIGTTETQRKLFFRLNKEHERLMKEGFNPGAKVLAQRLDVKEEDVQEMAKRLMAPDLSLDYVYGEESSQTLADRIGVEDNIAERVSDDELKSKRLAKLEEVKERFKTAFNPKERTIYEKRLFALEPATLQELGQELGITRERVRQLESGILKKFKQELGNDDDLFGGGTA